MPRHRAPQLLATIAVGCTITTISPESPAFETQVESETTAQGYQVRNIWGDPILSRRRYLQTLGLHITDIGKDETTESSNVSKAKGPDVSFHMRLRLDADFGVQPPELSHEYNPANFVPGLQRGPFDLMYGYFEIRNLANGLLSARAGRQYVIDALGWWSFDGVLARVDLPIYVGIEAYGGFEQRSGLPLSTGRFESGGVWRGDRTSIDAFTYPEFLKAGIAPTHGFVVESIGIPVVHGKIAYRRVWNTGAVVTNPFSDEQSSGPATTDGARISQERVGGSLDAVVDGIGAARSGLIYDLYRSQVTSWYGAVDGYVSSSITAGVDVDRVIPTFDGDSIWNWFTTEPTTTLLGRVDVGFTRRLRGSIAGGVRWVDVDLPDMDGSEKPDASTSNSSTSSSSASSSAMLDLLGRVSLRHDMRSGHVGVAGLTDRGERGSRDGFDVFAEQAIEERFLLSGRAGLYDWRDDLTPDKSTTSFGYMLGTGYRIGRVTTARLEWEHDVNGLVGQRYRVLASLQLLVNR
ncbi:MAG: hypothetical protein FWD57_01245 [Polyangiaceae bacterium]|nr:hypothetical protein [Polyangiaceae bacterium]